MLCFMFTLTPTYLKGLMSKAYDGCLSKYCGYRSLGVPCLEGQDELAIEMQTNPFDTPEEVK